MILAAGLGVRTLMAPRTWWRSALIGFGCVVAVTATPLGLSFWTEIPKSLARIRLYPIDEWRPPHVMDVLEVLFWVIAIVFCGALFRNRRRLSDATAGDLTLYACALAVLPTAMLAVRNVGPFLMIAVPAITSLLQIGRATGGRHTRRTAAPESGGDVVWRARGDRLRSCGPIETTFPISTGRRCPRRRCSPFSSAPKT